MAKKLTLETVIDRCNKLFNGKYDYSHSEFANIRTPFNVVCPVHGTFSITPKRHMNGQGCPICGKEYAKNIRKGNWKGFTDRFHEKYGDKFIFPNIESEYENEKSKITMFCRRCGSKYTVTGNYILSDRFGGCTACKYFHDYDYISNANKTGNEIVHFDGLKDSRRDKVTLICNEHGEYNVSISTILNGKGACSKCNGHRKLLTQDEAYRRLYDKYGDSIVPISKYIRSDKPMKFKCENGHVFERDYNTAMFGKLYSPCPFCSKTELSKRRTKTLDRFIEDAIRLYGDDAYDFTDSEYISSSDKITIKCNKCGEYFTIEANSFLQGHGCPNHGDKFISSMEQEIEELLKNNNIEYVSQYKADWLNNKSLDFYLPTYNIAIECQGKQHFENVEYFGGNYEFEKRKKRDNDKLNECTGKNIKLLYYADYKYDFPYKVFTDKNELLYEIINNKNDEKAD